MIRKILVALFFLLSLEIHAENNGKLDSRQSRNMYNYLSKFATPVCNEKQCQLPIFWLNCMSIYMGNYNHDTCAINHVDATKGKTVTHALLNSSATSLYNYLYRLGFPVIDEGFGFKMVSAANLQCQKNQRRYSCTYPKMDIN